MCALLAIMHKMTMQLRQGLARWATHIGRFSSKPATLALWPFWDSKGWQATVFRAALQMIAASMHHLKHSSENCCLSTFWRCSEHAPSEAQLWKSTGNSSSLKTCQMPSCKKHEKIPKKNSSLKLFFYGLGWISKIQKKTKVFLKRSKVPHNHFLL